MSTPAAAELGARGPYGAERVESLRFWTAELYRNKGAVVGAIVLVVIVGSAVLAPQIAPQPPDQLDLGARLLGPAWTEKGSWSHPLGTDALGRDELSRLLYGARVSLFTGFLVVLVAGAVGTLLGLVAGYFGGVVESLIMRVMDASIAFPGLLLALIVLTMVGPGQTTIVIVLAAISWMVYTKIAHDVVLSLREEAFVLAAEAVGSRRSRILRRHLLPNLVSPIATVATLEFGGVVLAEASLSYLGFGIQPPDSSWGLMIAEGQEYLTSSGWLVAIPGISIALVVLALNLVAGGVRVSVDPRRRERGARASSRRLRRTAPGEAPADDGAPLLEVRDLRVSFPLQRGGAVEAVRGVDLTIARGETLAIVGESGSGKSVTSLALMDLVPAPGETTARSRAWHGVELGDVRPRPVGRGITMVFQDPIASLNPLVPVGRQLTEVLRKHRGLGRAAAAARAKELFEHVGISSPERRLDQLPFEFSGGMAQRVALAIALAPEPELMIADEPTTALDVTIQAQILELIRSLQAEYGMAVLLIAHDLGVVAGLCDRVAVMYAGRIVEEGPAEAVFARPRHPYSAGLIASTPRLDRARGLGLRAIPGSPPSPQSLPPGCAFAPRCPRATAICTEQMPELERGEEDRSSAACWHAL